MPRPAQIFRDYGEERHAPAAAAAIVQYRSRPAPEAEGAAREMPSYTVRGRPVPRPILSTVELRTVIEGAIARRGRRARRGSSHTGLHPAARCFQARGGVPAHYPLRPLTRPPDRPAQALRIVVNRELDQLLALATAVPGLLAPGGVACPRPCVPGASRWAPLPTHTCARDRRRHVPQLGGPHREPRLPGSRAQRKCGARRARGGTRDRGARGQPAQPQRASLGHSGRGKCQLGR